MTLLELKEICKEYGYELSDKQLEQFDAYAKFLKEYNEKVNLTAITEYEEIIEKHFYDSILPLLRFDFDGHLVDVGAGAGFPSIPMKILKDSLEITILEPLHKRCVFLNELVKLLDLKNVTIVNTRAEDHALKYRESYDHVSARAVANLNVLSELCLPLVKVNGTFIVMKGQNGELELENASKAIEILGGKEEKRFIEHLSDESKRVNTIIRKVHKTPSKYPRAYGQIKKKPL